MVPTKITSNASIFCRVQRSLRHGAHKNNEQREYVVVHLECIDLAEHSI
jgi:hypothetical protein